MQTAWVRTGKEQYLRLTKFWGKLFLINFAMGVVTGIVQEFQFGMNWSDYSRFVGDVFGAPLAIEGLLAFFLESTFLGLWIFGWDRLPQEAAPRVHLVGLHRHHPVRVLHPRRELLDAAPGRRHWSTPRAGRAELTDIWAVLTNSTARRRVPPHDHRVLRDRRRVRARRHRLAPGTQASTPRSCAPSPAAGAGRRVLIAGVGVVVTGDLQAKVMTEAAADEDGRRRGAVRHRARPLVLAVHHRHARRRRRRSAAFEVPGVLSFLATGDLQRRRSRASTTSSSRRRRSTGPATTCRTSRSPTGPSG